MFNPCICTNNVTVVFIVTKFVDPLVTVVVVVETNLFVVIAVVTDTGFDVIVSWGTIETCCSSSNHGFGRSKIE